MLERAEHGDVDALAAFDACGLILGAAEDLDTWAKRVRSLTENLRKLERALAENRVFEVDGMRFPREARIDREVFEPAHDVTTRLYRFEARWTPGFYIDPSLGWLFGGCAYWFEPDFFALFVIRKVFAEREKWLFYRRTELLAHELCHAARAGFADRRFEEMHAYATAESAFRRRFGSMFRSPFDSYLLLFATFLLLLVQVVRFSVWYWLPAWPFWCFVAAVGLFFLVRQLHDLHQWNRALNALANAAGTEAARPILFRCSDREIAALAALRTPQEVSDWIDYRCRTSVRWQVVRRRFLKQSPGAGGLSDRAEKADDDAGA